MRALCGILLLALPAAAGEVRGKITQVVADAVYVDIGSTQGVAAGDAGEILRVGARIADVEVVTVSGSQARLSILRSTRRPQVGDAVVLRVRAKKSDEPEEEGAKRAPDERPFEPLLERQKKRADPTSERNILHGRVTFQQLVQSDREGDLDYAISMLSSDGMFDRIAGSRWSMRWSGNLYYRTGEAFDGSELDGEQLIVFDLSFARPVGEDGYLRFGRFLPRTLNSAGYFDGVDTEIAVGANTRLGAALGFKPTRFDLAPSFDEPAGLVYASYRAGKRGEAFASGSYGLLASAWEGEFDRAALLLEQIAELGKARLDVTATLDFDVGSSEFRDGTRLTQLDAFLSWRIAKVVTLRAGADRWERLDTAAERARFPILDPLLYEDGFWRTWLGAVFVLPARLRLDLEYASINSDTGPTTRPWRATLEHYDPFGIAGGNLSLTVYSLEGFIGDGYGGLFNANFPFAGGKWLLRSTLGFRYVDSEGNEFDVTDVRVNVDYLPGGGWQLSGGVQWLGGTALDSLLFEFRVDYRF
ncbi:MAG: hypothetical protein ACYS0E_06865 [Planctomycetota bacterium]